MEHGYPGLARWLSLPARFIWLIIWFVAAWLFFLGQMSTTQPGVLPRMVSDMTFAPDSPIPFPCKLQKRTLMHLFMGFNTLEQNIHRQTVFMMKLFSHLCVSTGLIIVITYFIYVSWWFSLKAVAMNMAPSIPREFSCRLMMQTKG